MTVPEVTVPLALVDALPFGATRPYFADLHVHSHDTVGTNSTESNLLFARDLAGVDVLGYTASVAPAAHGALDSRPLYLFARELGDAKVGLARSSFKRQR